MWFSNGLNHKPNTINHLTQSTFGFGAPTVLATRYWVHFCVWEDNTFVWGCKKLNFNKFSFGRLLFVGTFFWARLALFFVSISVDLNMIPKFCVTHKGLGAHLTLVAHVVPGQLKIEIRTLFKKIFVEGSTVAHWYAICFSVWRSPVKPRWGIKKLNLKSSLHWSFFLSFLLTFIQCRLSRLLQYHFRRPVFPNLFHPEVPLARLEIFVKPFQNYKVFPLQKFKKD